MARPKGTLIVAFDPSVAIRTTKAALAAANLQVAGEIQADIQRKSARLYPPASKPGQYPRMRTGEFNTGVYVSGTANGIRVYSEAPHGVHLQYGTKNMEPRPWATKSLESRDWGARVQKLAAAYMERTGYGPKGRMK